MVLPGDLSLVVLLSGSTILLRQQNTFIIKSGFYKKFGCFKVYPLLLKC